MREIKFRAWDSERNIMKRPSVNMMIDTFNGTCYWQFGYYISLMGKLELMQYTGLKDKNGKEIYEGDIVRVYGNPQLHEDFEYQATVEWIDYAKFQYKLKSGVSGDMGIHIVEIIGNIYESKHLLDNTDTKA